jgi:uncharacterized protein (DUF1800 family)
MPGIRERMTWFWFNHFNVHQYKANIRILVYEGRVIRPHAMGHFRDLLARRSTTRLCCARA